MSDFKPRKLVYKQAKNQLQTMADLFIAPFLHYRRPDEATMHFLERLFCVNTRHIVQCMVRQPIQIGHKTIGTGRRVFVRHDTSMPELYEIDASADTGPVHRLTRSEWMRVRDSLAVIDKNRDGVPRMFGVRA
jgi:hypothetical protein